MKYFVYCRKSSEAEDRQVLSIESQLSTLKRTFGDRREIEIVGVYEEAYSAKAPGRIRFNEMLSRIERGEAHGIIAWAPDRLARNSIDGGRVVYLLDRGSLLDLKFATYTFENNSQGKFMLQIMFGQSKYYSDALSENVKRGLRTKIERGEWPSTPPIGYRFDRDTRTIVPDTTTYPLVQRMWDLLLSGAYSPSQICTMANKWGLRTAKRKSLGGRPVARSAVYTLFSNPFYAGVLPWKGQIYPGKHQRMITLDQFQQGQELLGRPGRPRPQKHHFPFVGYIRCGNCGLSITAENKTKRSGRHYTYYHCTRRAVPKCTEQSIETQDLDAQFLAFIRGIELPVSVHEWAVDQLEEVQSNKRSLHDARRATLETALAGTERKLRILIDLRLDDAFNNAEFVERRRDLQQQALALRQSLDEDNRDLNWFEPIDTLISFSNRAVSWFQNGNGEVKRLIAQTVGSNYTLTSKILNGKAAKPFFQASDLPDCPTRLAWLNEVRTMIGTPELDYILHNIAMIKFLRGEGPYVAPRPEHERWLRRGVVSPESHTEASLAAPSGVPRRRRRRRRRPPYRRRGSAQHSPPIAP